jgi:hypothetical protein
MLKSLNKLILKEKKKNVNLFSVKDHKVRIIRNMSLFVLETNFICLI